MSSGTLPALRLTRLDRAMSQSSGHPSIVIAAAGRYGRNTGSLLISRHSVVPVASYDEPDGRFPVRTSRHRLGAATCLRPASGVRANCN